MIQEYFHYLMDDFDNGSFIFCSISQPIPSFSMNAMNFERHLSGSMMNAFQPIQKVSMLFFFFLFFLFFSFFNYRFKLYKLPTYPFSSAECNFIGFFFLFLATCYLNFPFIFFPNLLSEVFFDCCIGQILFLFGKFLLGLHFFCLPLCFVNYC